MVADEYEAMREHLWEDLMMRWLNIDGKDVKPFEGAHEMVTGKSKSYSEKKPMVADDDYTRLRTVCKDLVKAAEIAMAELERLDYAFEGPEDWDNMMEAMRAALTSARKELERDGE